MRTKLNPPPKEKKKKKKGKSQKGIKMTAGIEKVHVLHPKIIWSLSLSEWTYQVQQSSSSYSSILVLFIKFIILVSN